VDRGLLRPPHHLAGPARGVELIRYLSRPEVAERIGVKPDTLNRYKLPLPDAQIGSRLLGWLPETIDRWNAARPSRQDSEAGG
jgi:predicted DNA-binding transcriptional regulator AlpA